MNSKHISTLAVHAGTASPASATEPKVLPIVASSVWSFDSLAQLDDVYENKVPGFVYSRISNPTVGLLEQAVGMLEGGAAAAYASGMAAIATAIFAEVRQGDHIVAHHVLYGGTYALLKNEMAKLGVEVTFVDCNDLSAVAQAIRPNTKILYLETICNPLMEVLDIPAIVQLARTVKAKVYVDNTFASPYHCQPLAHGADVVLHSATKYLNGHSDAMAGVIVADSDFIAKAKNVGTTYGATLSPFDAWLTLRGLKTLALRMHRHAENALALAKYLQVHPKVTGVNYPGLESTKTHGCAKKLLQNGFGGMLSFTVQGGLAGARTVIDSLEMVKLVPSLAGPATTTSHPAKTSHRAMPAAEREACGVSDGLIRVSVGLEEAADIIADFDQALAKL